MKTKIFWVFLSLCWVGTASSEPLSSEALYHRCYAQLTGHKLQESDAKVAKLRSGTLEPVKACLDLLDSAKLARKGDDVLRLPAGSSMETRWVLSRLHEVHATFFSEKMFQYPQTDETSLNAMMDILDPTNPALYYTRALFGDNVKASTIVTYGKVLKPIRLNNPELGPFRGGAKSSFIYLTPFNYAGTGDLLGIEEMAAGSELLRWSSPKTTGQTDLAKTLGSGFAGTHTYLMETVNEDADFVTNVAKMPRRFANAYYKDVLCREFPLIREQDAVPFVVKNSSLPFRTEASCVKCHASMDRIASTMRGFSYWNPHVKGQLKELMAYQINKPDLKAENGWPAVEDNDFNRRPSAGTIYYRSALNGDLVDIPVTSLADAGRKLSVQDDYYLCLANRYWNYFTGTGVKLDDALILDQQMKSDASLKRRLTVIKKLASDLKTHQSLRLLIEDIFRRPEYSDSGYGQ